MKNYYTILELPQNSSEEEIRKAYRRLAKRYHPDVNKSADAHEKFLEISEAYEFLIHQHKQAIFAPTAKESQGTSDRDREASEHFRNEARQKAQQQARMRYEEFKKQHEAFRNSGLSDITLLLTSFIRILFLPVFLFLLLLPVYVAWTNEWQMIFLFVITWPFACIIAWYIHDHREHYFLPGTFFYSPRKILRLFTEKNPSDESCYYCRSKTANSKPYQFELLKLKEVKVQTRGFRQHHASYINDSVKITVPRSRKAFLIHSLVTILKLISILYCLIFLDISSLVWRIIIGMFAGGVIGFLVTIVTGTKSNVSYLWSYGFLIRAFVWVLAIACISHFDSASADINTSGYIYFTVTCIVLFDCFLMQLVNFLLGKNSSRPVVKQYNDAQQKFNEGYRMYNDVTVISVVYPIYKWIFG